MLNVMFLTFVAVRPSFSTQTGVEGSAFSSIDAVGGHLFDILVIKLLLVAEKSRCCRKCSRVHANSAALNLSGAQILIFYIKT